MAEPKLSSGSGGIRHIQNPTRLYELGITNRDQVYDETPIHIPGLGDLETRTAPGPSARVLKRRAFRASRRTTSAAIVVVEDKP